MSISAYYITNVLRTYHSILKLDPRYPSREPDPEARTTDMVDISPEGKYRLEADQASVEKKKSTKG